MMRSLTALLLILVSIVGFFMFTKPLFNDITLLKLDVIQYDQALANARALKDEQDKLIQKYNDITPENITKLNKLLPDNVDNIRLILEIGKIALPYGMILKDVKYDALSLRTDKSTVPAGIVDSSQTPLKDYGTWDLQFSTMGRYDNFVAFLKDLQSNLRIIDIASIDFASDAGGTTSGASQTYNYGFKIKTYWLKN